MVATPKKNGSPGKGISPPKMRTTRSQTRDSAAPETPKKSPGKAAATPKATPSKMAIPSKAATPKYTPAKASFAKANTPKASPTKASTPKSSPAKASTPKASPAKASSAKMAVRAPASARKPTSALATATPITAQDSSDEEIEEEDEDEEESDEESDLEEGQDVSDKGMQRLMDALGEKDLNGEDLAALAAARGEEEDDDDEDDQEDEDDADEVKLDEEEDVEEDDIPRVIPNKTGDTLAASIARSGLVAQDESSEEEKEEEEALSDIEYEALPDTVQLSEEAKASQVQRIKVNNKEALTRLAQDVRLDSSLPWIETMRVTYDHSVSEQVPDVSNDLDRELAFYKQALHTAVEGRKLVLASGTPFTRPNDYFAEMVKTDEHMERVRQKLLDESAAIKASETAKKQRELKKFGKKVQVEKLEERLRKKKEMNEKVKGLKRKHGDLDDGDDFDVRLEEALADKKPKKDGPKRKMPRNARNAKYGFGGKKRHAKSNTAESTNDFGGPKKGKPGTFKSKPKTGAAKRPGKSRRAGGGKR